MLSVIRRPQCPGKTETWLKVKALIVAPSSRFTDHLQMSSDMDGCRKRTFIIGDLTAWHRDGRTVHGPVIGW